MLKFFSKLLRYLERWEYQNSLSFWFCTISLYLCFTTLFNNLPNFSENSSQAQVVVENVRGGGKQQHEVINSVDNLAKKKYFKEMQVKHFMLLLTTCSNFFDDYLSLRRIFRKTR